MFISISFEFFPQIDSLKMVLKNAKSDTAKSFYLNKISDQSIKNGLINESIELSNQSLVFSEKSKYYKGEARANFNLGKASFINGNYKKAISYFEESKKIYTQINAKISSGNCLNAIGNAYLFQNNSPKALQCYFDLMVLQADIKDSLGLAITQNNIGNVYYQQNQLDKAKAFYNKALNQFYLIKDSVMATMSLDNLANIYADENQNEKALELYFKVLISRLKEGDKLNISNSYDNIGIVYKEKNEYEKALTYFNKSLIIRKELDYKEGLVLSYSSIASCYVSQKKQNMAIENYNKALQFAIQTTSFIGIQDIELKLSEVYEVLNNNKMALLHYKKYKIARDSLFNEEKTENTVKAEMNYEFDKIQTADSLKTVETKKINDLKLKQEQTQKIALYFGISLIAIFSFFIYNRFRLSNKQKKIIELQKISVEAKNLIIEETQKEILDSIHYAKRIQYALLANEKVLQKNIPEHFVLFKPKDIVSGDFYWATEHDNKFYLAVCDSTGHGVPGAFMSLLNIGFLSEAIKEKNINKPNEVLNYVRKRLIESIGNDGQQDGMDAILVCFDKTLNTISYSAANNEPILISNNNLVSELSELPKDRMPVGKGERMDSFTLQTIDFKKGDTLYLYTDGFADQFGGPKGKKFKYKSLNDLLLSNENKSMLNQKEILIDAFTGWKGNLEQVDDVCIIGIKL